MSEEGLWTTPNKLIFIGNPIPFDEDVFLRKLQGLMTVAYDGKENIIRQCVADIVTTFYPEPPRATQTEIKFTGQADMEIAKLPDAAAIGV